MLSTLLTSVIDNELRWREAELAIAKMQLQRSLHDMPLFRFAYRCFISMTYAHFEAYTKLVIAQAMSDIFRSGCLWSSCLPIIQTNLFAPALRSKIKELSNEDLASCGSVPRCLIDDVPPPSLNIILDCGNMNVTNFVWAVGSIGLDTANFAFARRDVGRLASLRHECAHGEALTLDATKTPLELARDVYNLQSRIVFVMHTLAVEIVDHFASGSYISRP